MGFEGFAMSSGFVAVAMFLGLLGGLFLGHPLAFVLGGLATIFGLHLCSDPLLHIYGKLYE